MQKALKMLIDVCVTFGIENDIVHNEEKAKCMCIKPFIVTNVYVHVSGFLLGHLKMMVVGGKIAERTGDAYSQF